MKATHRVINSDNEPIGFIIENKNMYTDAYIGRHIEIIDNLENLETGRFECKKELPIMRYTDVKTLKNILYI